jgi:phosphate-selective porin OprO and OprP
MLSLVVLVPPVAKAQQQETDERALIDVQDGIRISKDSLFLLNLRFRLQSRIGFITEGGDDLDINRVDARVRRMRLRLDGFVLQRRLQYYIQLSCSKADMDLESGTVPQTIRDAMVYYTFNRNFYVGFGQSKLPGNRQRVISSGNLQFPDRSIANSAFTLDRDFGMFAYWTIPVGAQEVHVKGAFTTGDGRGASPGGPGMCYTGRLGWLPFGAFTKGGDYSEGDLEFEPRPKLNIAATYSFNDRAYRTGGQLGPELYDERDITTIIADMMFKYRGWGVLAEYFDRRSTDPITRSLDGDVRAVQVGRGGNVQASRMLPRHFELALRYAQVLPDASVAQLGRGTEELLLGSTKYINGHRIKLQLYVGYRWLDNNIALEHPGNAWTTMFQVEFGI